VKKPFLAACTFGAPVAPAVAADMPIRARAYVPRSPVWTGLYAGLDAGHADVENSVTTVASGTPDAALGVISRISQGLASPSTLAIPAESGSDFAAAARSRSQ
jgi:hypothetical protein